MNINENFLLYAVLALSILIIALIWWVWKLDRRLKNILGNKKSSDIETSILENHKRLGSLEEFREKTLMDLKNKEDRIRRSVQAIKTIRFNPFKGTGSGGNQSFSSALLNEKGDGVVFTGLYSRERVSVYAKPLEEFKGEFEFTEEEKEAIGKARDLIKKDQEN